MMQSEFSSHHNKQNKSHSISRTPLPEKLINLNNMYNDGNNKIDYITMKRLLTKLNTSKFCFLKYDEEESKRLWRSLLKNQMDTSISLSKLQSLLATPLKDESKSSNRTMETKKEHIS